MKKILLPCLRSLVIAGLLLLMGVNARASHVIGAQLSYQWLPSSTCDSQKYQVTLTLYGDCSSTSGSFQTLPVITPEICIFDGATFEPAAALVPAANPMILGLPIPMCGTEVTPVCPDSLAYTTCTSISYPIAGIKKFVCTGIVTLPHPSANWKFVYTSNNGTTSRAYSCIGTSGSGTATPSASGRTAAITNIVSGTSIQLIATLNNSLSNPRGYNSNPVLTVEPTPFYCDSNFDAYNPGAIDLYDVSPAEPSGDSLVFSLVNATDGSGGCGAIGGSATYIGGTSGANPLQGVTDLTFDPLTGQMGFTPTINQRSVVVYNIQEYINDTLGQMSTIAGTGIAGYAGDGASALGAELNRPAGICMDAAGNVYEADYANNRIRKINTSGIIDTIAGNGVAGYAGDGNAALVAELNHPVGLALNAAGDLFFADHDNNVVRKISAASGIITTVAGSGAPGYAGNTTSASSGVINTIAGIGTAGFLGDGAAAAAAELNNPAGICMDAAGNIYFSDYNNNRIRKIAAGTSIISTIAGNGAVGYSGDGGSALGAALHNPMGLAIDAGGNLYFADYNNHVCAQDKWWRYHYRSR